MESTPLNPLIRNTHSSASFPMDKRTKQDPHAPAFIQALTQATQLIVSHTIKAEPANLARHTEPRSHLQLTSLSPVQTCYTPEPAAFEHVGKSRIVPFTVGD
jgi:hypothetical protein